MDFIKMDDGYYVNPRYIVAMRLQEPDKTHQKYVLTLYTVDGQKNTFTTEEESVFNDKISQLKRLCKSRFLVNSITGAICGLD